MLQVLIRTNLSSLLKWRDGVRGEEVGIKEKGKKKRMKSNRYEESRPSPPTLGLQSCIHELADW